MRHRVANPETRVRFSLSAPRCRTSFESRAADQYVARRGGADDRARLLSEEDVGSNPTDETRLLRRRSMAGRSALTRVMVVRVHPSQPGSWPRSSVEEQLGPNETVAGSNPAGAPNVFVAFWLSTTGRAPGC